MTAGEDWKREREKEKKEETKTHRSERNCSPAFAMESWQDAAPGAQ